MTIVQCSTYIPDERGHTVHADNAQRQHGGKRQDDRAGGGRKRHGLVDVHMNKQEPQFPPPAHSHPSPSSHPLTSKPLLPPTHIQAPPPTHSHPTPSSLVYKEYHEGTNCQGGKDTKCGHEKEKLESMTAEVAKFYFPTHDTDTTPTSCMQAHAIQSR